MEGTALIEIKNLKKTYNVASDRALTALSDINITIQDGEIFGIIGLSGAGKSTLVRCINLLEKPTEGDVIIDGKNMMQLSKKELLLARRDIGMIFQNFNLLEQRTVLRNVCFPLEIAGVKKAKAVARARELLELVGLTDKEKSYPSQLSGGQKQRVAIARALASNPKYLLCDEATSALDPNTTNQILELLDEINKKLGVTIIVITHEMRVIDRICDRVAVIDHSQIAEIGRVSDVFTSPKSQIARELILPGSKQITETCSGKLIRIVFDGLTTNKPIISSIVMECQVPVNIIFADTKIIDEMQYGQMVIQLPDDIRETERVLIWLKENKIPYREEL